MADTTDTLRAVDMPRFCSALLRSIGDKKEVIHGEEHEEIMLVERVGSVGLVKNTISFMGEKVATLWALITLQVSLPNWQETKPDWPNGQSAGTAD